MVLAWHTATETTLCILLSHLMLSSVGLDGGYCRGAGMAHCYRNYATYSPVSSNVICLQDWMAASVVVLAWHTATETTLRILLSHLMLSAFRTGWRTGWRLLSWCWHGTLLQKLRYVFSCLILCYLPSGLDGGYCRGAGMAHCYRNYATYSPVSSYVICLQDWMAATVVVLAWHTATETTLHILLSHLMLSSVGLDGGYCRGAGMAHCYRNYATCSPVSSNVIICRTGWRLLSWCWHGTLLQKLRYVFSCLI